MSTHQAVNQRVLDEAATLVARIDRLPAVATPGWADHAAGALRGLEGVHSVCVLVWRSATGPGGSGLEAAGVSLPGGAEDAVLMLRSRIERGAREGEIRPTAGPDVGIGPLDRDAAGASRAALWAGLPVDDVLATTITIDGGRCARAAECLVALGTGLRAARAEEIGGVIRAASPALAERASMALAPGEEGESPWLTERETLVLEHLIRGLSVRLIAEQIGRSPHTVHDHVKNLHRKLGASTRGELVARALGFRGWAPDSTGARRAEAWVEPKRGEAASRVAQPGSA